MITLPKSSLDVLADRFELLHNKLPEGWVWDPVLVKTPPLKPNDIADFAIRGWLRESDFMVVFCKHLVEHITIKVLLAYRGDKKAVAISEARAAWLKDDLGRNEGDILFGVRCMVTVVNCPAPKEPVNHLARQSPHQIVTEVPSSVRTSHHGGGRDVQQVVSNPTWNSWRKLAPPGKSPLREMFLELEAARVRPAPVVTQPSVAAVATLPPLIEVPSPLPAKKKFILVE